MYAHVEALHSCFTVLGCCSIEIDLFLSILITGRGRIIPDGRASISFCSDNVSPNPGENFDGFVVRATCINPAEFLAPSCVDYPFFAVWDPQFTRIIEDLPPVTYIIITIN